MADEKNQTITLDPISPKDLNFDKKVQELMSYHQQTLEFEKKAAKQKILDRGINFDSHMQKLLQAKKELQDALSEYNVDLEKEEHTVPGENQQGEKVDYKTYIEIYVDVSVSNYPYRQSLKQVRVDFIDKNSTMTVLTISIPSEIFSNSSAWKNHNILRLMTKSKLLKSISRDIETVKKMKGCGTTIELPMGKDINITDPAASDYVAFSRIFHIDVISRQEKKKEEIIKENKQKGISDEVSTTNQNIKGSWDVLKKDGAKVINSIRSTGEGIEYTIQQGDEIYPNPPAVEKETGLKYRLSGPIAGSYPKLKGEDILSLMEKLNLEGELMSMNSQLAGRGNGFKFLVGKKIRIPAAPTVSFETDFWPADLTGEEVVLIFKRYFLDPFFRQLCPETLLERILECLLPSDCREIIKYIGLEKTRDLLEPLILLEAGSSAFEALGLNVGLREAFEEWDRVASQRFNLKASRFTGGSVAGQLDGSKIYAPGADDFSFSMHLSVASGPTSLYEERQQNDGKTKYLVHMQDTFAIIKTNKENLRFRLISAEGKVIEYSTASIKDEIELFDGNFHQIGFSYLANAGMAFFYIDGRKFELEREEGEFFLGRLGTKETCDFTIASKDFTKTSQNIFGMIDEVAIWNRGLSDEEWKMVNDLGSAYDKNYNSISGGMTAWWRMGDNFEDVLKPSIEDSKLTDSISSQELLPLQGKTVNSLSSEHYEVRTVRRIAPKDEDIFINILQNHVDLQRICQFVFDLFTGAIATNVDYRNIANNILPKFPTFSPKPHQQMRMSLEKAVIEGALVFVAQWAFGIVNRVILSCESWRPLAQALTKGTFNLDFFDPALAAEVKNSPLGNLFNEQGFEQFVNEQVLSGLGPGLQNMLRSPIKMTSNTTLDEDGKPKQHEASLGIGNLSVNGNLPELGVETYEDGMLAGWDEFGPVAGSDAAIVDYGAPDNVRLDILRNTTSQLSVEQFLEALSSQMSQATYDNIDSYIYNNYQDYHESFTEEEIRNFYSTMGVELGLDNAIPALQGLADDIMNSANSPDNPCPPGQSFRDILGLPMSDLDAQRARDFLNDQQNQLDEAAGKRGCTYKHTLSDIQKRSLTDTINDVYSSVVSSYDRDLLLFRMGSISYNQKEKKIKKIFKKGDTETVTTFDPETQKMKTERVLIEKTQINPQFEGLIEQGYIPLKEDGSEDGTPFGGAMKKDWSFRAFLDGEWGKEKGPYSFAPTVEGDKVKDSKLGSQDIAAALGPYTDYDLKIKDSKYAKVYVPEVSTETDGTKAFSKDKLGFIGTGTKTADGTGYISQAENQNRGPKTATRGIEDIKSNSKSSIFENPGPRASNKQVKIKKEILSTIKHISPIQRDLSGDMTISFDKVAVVTGNRRKERDPYSFDVSKPFEMKPTLKNKLLSDGYQEDEPNCDDSVVSDDEDTAGTESGINRYTPQENVFGFIANKKNSNLGERNTKVVKSDEIYKEVVNAVMLKISDSPLLKKIPNTDTPDGFGPLYGINFLNLNPRPRLIDMFSFADQVAKDYEALISCPEGLDSPPLRQALKTSAPRILARVCLIDFMLKGIVPFSALFFDKKDQVIKKFIVKSLEKDIDFFAEDPSLIRQRIIERYNEQVSTGVVDGEEVDTSEGSNWESSGWKTAMEYFIEDEFDFIANKIHNVVSGGCVPSSEETRQEGMRQIVADYAEKKRGKLRITKKIKLVDQEEEVLQDKFDFMRDYRDVEYVATEFSYEGLILERIQISMEDILAQLGIDPDTFTSTDCRTGETFRDAGFTIEHDGHFHSYEIDASGNGVTTSTEGNSEPHEHAIFEYTVRPYFVAENQTEAVPHHSHALQAVEPSAITNNALNKRIFDYLKSELVNTADFRILFDYCFNVSDAASLALVYGLLSASNEIVDQSFRATKREVMKMFDILWMSGTQADPCATAIAQTEEDQLGRLLPDFGQTQLSPELLLGLLLAPLLTYRGWVKVTDPNIFISTTITDALSLPLMPKNKKMWVPSLNPINNPDFGKLKCENIPVWPGNKPLDTLFAGSTNNYNPLGDPYDTPPLYIPAFGIEIGISGLVAWSGLPPTPFGFIYYGVAPLIWMLKDLPRLLKEMEKNQESQQIIASTGLNIAGILDCNDDKIEESAGTQEDDEEQQDEEDCPPRPRSYDDTVVDSRRAKEC